MTEKKKTPCYLVKTIPELVASSKVGVGWSDFDCSDLGDSIKVIDEINKSYGIGKRGNQIRRYFAINDDDFIVVNLPYCVAIGRANGGLFYDEDFYESDRANQRRVNFPLNDKGEVIKIPRTSFSERFQRRLRVQGMTVNDLSEFHHEISAAYESVNSGKEYSWDLQLAEKTNEAEKAFKAELLKNIQSGRTNLKAGGIGLEYLVKELLSIEGYESDVMSKRAFPDFADADVKASKTDPCSAVNLLVQVKHHRGFSDEHGLSQLEEIKKQDLSEWSDYGLVFCTSASVTDTFTERAQNLSITVIDGKGLVDWIFQVTDQLSLATKTSLGICEVPSLHYPH